MRGECYYHGIMRTFTRYPQVSNLRQNVTRGADHMGRVLVESDSDIRTRSCYTPGQASHLAEGLFLRKKGEARQHLHCDHALRLSLTRQESFTRSGYELCRAFQPKSLVKAPICLNRFLSLELLDVFQGLGVLFYKRRKHNRFGFDREKSLLILDLSDAKFASFISVSQ